MISRARSFANLAISSGLTRLVFTLVAATRRDTSCLDLVPSKLLVRTLVLWLF